MISRPKNTDTMEDIHKMEKEFLEEKSKQNFTPAAQAIKKINKGESDKKPKSLFARQRNLKQENAKLGNELSVMSDVIERKYDAAMEVDETQSSLIFEEEFQPFPKTININLENDKLDGKSIFARVMAENHSQAMSSLQQANESDNLREIYKSINEENSKLLESMSKDEIMQEREKLLQSLDPGLLNFLRNKRKNIDQKQFPANDKAKMIKVTFDEEKLTEEIPALDILKNENSANWLNMNLIEPEKLEWTKDIDSVKEGSSIKPGEKFEARFDWKGCLLPPNNVSQNEFKDERELFLHGDEPNRPGYTLQELFRLARANVLQQRTSALMAIAGILNIYNQGYYDRILQLPLSKIFFFLRFAADENVPVIIQSAMRGISVLFYNETDETLLDATYETPSGYYQPLMSMEQLKDVFDEDTDDFENAFKGLNLTEEGSLINCAIEDDVEVKDKQNLSDFHLAETNLVDCLLRTNIIERITYILLQTEPNPNTVEYCTKILIRIARDSQKNASTIVNKQNLMQALAFKNLSAAISSSMESMYLIMKLFRIIGAYNGAFIETLLNYGIIDNAIRFITMKEDLQINLVRLQIECFRFLRLFFHVIPDENKYNQLLMPMRYLLEWHYQFLDFTASNHFIIRSHASALLHLLGRSNITVSFTIFGEIFKMCCCKWYHMVQRNGANEFSQRVLLSSLLDVASNFIKFGPEFFYDFVNDYFIKFMKSSYYKDIEESLSRSSILLKNKRDRRKLNALANLGTVVQRGVKTLPSLILSREYSAYYLQSILTFINSFNNEINIKNLEYYKQLKMLFFVNGGIEKYMREFCELNKRQLLSVNWFAIVEIEFIFNILKTMYDDKCPWLFKASFNILSFLSPRQFPLALDIFDKFIFNEKFYDGNVSKEDLDSWKFVYNGVIMSRIMETKSKYVAVFDNWNEAVLNNDWTYSLLLFLLYKIDINTESRKIVDINLKEVDIIRTTLKFNSLLHQKEVVKLSYDEKLMYLMLIYFGTELNFLDSEIKELISKEINLLKKGSFTFNSKLNGGKSFENLYLMLLETFQANGYGDNLFSALVMIPLAQKYDIKWRKLIWSEYAMVLKFIKCTETDLLVELREYLYPIESDESLIKSYMSALQTNHLVKGSLPWTIAEHHVINFLPIENRSTTQMKIDEN